MSADYTLPAWLDDSLGLRSYDKTWTVGDGIREWRSGPVEDPEPLLVEHLLLVLGKPRTDGSTAYPCSVSVVIDHVFDFFRLQGVPCSFDKACGLFVGFSMQQVWQR